MIDLARPFRVESVPGVLLYADTKIPSGWYSLPDRPRVAEDDKGRPAFKLLLYGREDRVFEVTGGLVTCTLSLRLTVQEKALLSAACGPGAQVELQMLWSKGQCELKLNDSIQLTGEPSLYGDNDCVMRMSLDQEAARHLEKEFLEGPILSWARYNLWGQPPAGDLCIEGKLDTGKHDLGQLISRIRLS